MKFLLGIIFFFLVILVWVFVRPSFFPLSYRTDYSEGSCSFMNNSCKWAGEACGGGHGVCTNEPSKYTGRASICDINYNFPSMMGYRCSCLAFSGKCGWVK